MSQDRKFAVICVGRFGDETDNSVLAFRVTDLIDLSYLRIFRGDDGKIDAMPVFTD